MVMSVCVSVLQFILRERIPAVGIPVLQRIDPNDVANPELFPRAPLSGQSLPFVA